MTDDAAGSASKEELAAHVEELLTGGTSRAEFLGRTAALGLSAGAVGSLLSAGPALARAGHAAAVAEGTPLPDAQKLVYPRGIADVKNYVGPYGVGPAGSLPSNYHGPLNSQGLWPWKYEALRAPKKYRMAFMHFGHQVDTSVEVLARMQRFGDIVGVQVDGFDNNLDVDTTIRNAQLIAAQKYDYAMVGTISSAACATSYRLLKAAGIPSSYLANEAANEPGALFFDTDIGAEYFWKGQYAGTYAKQHWGGRVDLVVFTSFLSGPFFAKRHTSFVAGVRSVIKGIPNSRSIFVDATTVSTATSQTKTADALSRFPKAKYILACGVNDDIAVGVVRALEAAGLDKTAAVIGHAGMPSAVAELMKPQSAFKASGFYDAGGWAWMAAVGLLTLMGGKVSIYNNVPIFHVTSKNIRSFPKQANVLKPR